MSPVPADPGRARHDEMSHQRRVADGYASRPRSGQSAFAVGVLRKPDGARRSASHEAVVLLVSIEQRLAARVRALMQYDLQSHAWCSTTYKAMPGAVRPTKRWLVQYDLQSHAWCSTTHKAMAGAVRPTKRRCRCMSKHMSQAHVQTHFRTQASSTRGSHAVVLAYIELAYIVLA